jgi:hypothetical protein
MMTMTLGADKSISVDMILHPCLYFWFPNGRAKMFQPESAPEDLFMHVPWIPAACQAAIHNI